MFKSIKILLIGSIITILSIVPAFAWSSNGFGGGMRGGSFGSAGFGGASIDTEISYDALSILVNEINSTISVGQFTGSPVNGNTNVACTIVNDMSTGRKVIGLYNQGWYYYKNQSGGTVYAYYDSDSDLHAIRDWVASTYNVVNNTIAVHIASIDSMCTNISNTISAMLNHTAYLPGIDSTLRNISNALVDSSTNTSFVDAINNMSAKIMAPHIRIGYRSGTPSTYSTMPNGAVDNMIAYYNIFYHWYKIQPTQETNGDYYIDYLFVDNNGFVRVHTWDVNRGQFNDYYLLTRWNPIKVSGSGYNGSFDDTNIVNAINRIYDWLDNADLATNSTIVTIVNNSQQDVNNAQGLYDLVKTLFKTAYGNLDDYTSLNDWTSAAGYFGNLWSDPQP